MATDFQSIEQQFEHLFQVISSSRFLQKQGLGNEVPFFITAFPATKQNQVDRLTKSLVSKLGNHGVYVLEVNLYDLSIELMRNRKTGETNVWDRMLEKERTLSKQDLKQQMMAILDVETKLTPAIQAKMQLSNFNVLFLTGVGLVYPFIRSHSVLNNLQKVAKEKPTVLFFPGTYTFADGNGSSLDLFAVLNEDKYYRAFNLNDYKL